MVNVVLYFHIFSFQNKIKRYYLLHLNIIRHIL